MYKLAVRKLVHFCIAGNNVSSIFPESSQYLPFLCYLGFFVFSFLMRGIEPRALHMLSKHSAPELHPSRCIYLFVTGLVRVAKYS
jgi:hypothetical protein